MSSKWATKKKKKQCAELTTHGKDHCYPHYPTRYQLSADSPVTRRQDGRYASWDGCIVSCTNQSGWAVWIRQRTTRNQSTAVHLTGWTNHSVARTTDEVKIIKYARRIAYKQALFSSKLIGIWCWFSFFVLIWNSGDRRWRSKTGIDWLESRHRGSGQTLLDTTQLPKPK